MYLVGEGDEQNKSRRAMDKVHSVMNLKNLEALVSLSDFDTLSLTEKASNWDPLAELMSSSVQSSTGRPEGRTCQKHVSSLWRKHYQLGQIR
jgi:hypothetical protein